LPFWNSDSKDERYVCQGQYFLEEGVNVTPVMATASVEHIGRENSETLRILKWLYFCEKNIFFEDSCL